MYRCNLNLYQRYNTSAYTVYTVYCMVSDWSEKNVAQKWQRPVCRNSDTISPANTDVPLITLAWFQLFNNSNVRDPQQKCLFLLFLCFWLCSSPQLFGEDEKWFVLWLRMHRYRYSGSDIRLINGWIGYLWQWGRSI